MSFGLDDRGLPLPQDPNLPAVVPREPGWRGDGKGWPKWEPPCDMCQGAGQLKDDTSKTGMTPCPMCRGKKNNEWRKEVVQTQVQVQQVWRTLRLVVWLVMAFLFFGEAAWKGMWPICVVAGLGIIKFVLWLRRENGKKTEGSLT